MASLIPKIKIGLAQNRKEKHNLSFDCSTTANIGTIQPTMCREMVPNAKFKVKVSSLVRLASMPLPTFGRISLRNYHVFVPYIDLWQPFDAMMAGQHYVGSNSSAFIPTQTPYFTMHEIQQFIIDYSEISIAPNDDLNNPLTITTTNVDWEGNLYKVGTESDEYATMELAIKAAQAADLARIQSVWSDIRSGNSSIFDGQTYDGIFYNGRGSKKQDDYGVLNLGDFAASVKSSDDTLTIAYIGQAGNVSLSLGQTAITADGADLITRMGVTGYSLLMKFKAPLKRLRTIFIGLGYQFSPYNTEYLNPFKLLAYYKSWFALFRPNRELTFVDTACYKLIKKSSEVNGSNLGTGLGTSSWWIVFIKSLMFDCYYYLPQDYFSMSVLQPVKSNQDVDFIMNSGSMGNTSGSSTSASAYTGDNVTVKNQNNTGSYADTPAVTINSNGTVSPLTIQLAMRMLKWANKNTVIGRSIREYLKVHFGITDTNEIEDDAVYRIGSSRTNIQISDVMSTAENSEGYLGEYGGKGIGYGDSETFDFTADKFGVWITLTAVVPESGYYQGYLKENRHMNRYQFFNPEFDAIGYQVLERGEVMDDYNCDSATWLPRQNYYRSAAFGFVPRYSEYKVGRNIVNGDLSLIGMYASMGGYTLDRRISAGLLTASKAEIPISTLRSFPQPVKIVAPSFVPSVVYDNFRRIDPTDHLGQYNRMFNVVSNDLDHFIIHAIFDVKAFMPMKSLSNSFDTIDKDDDGSIDVTHS